MSSFNDVNVVHIGGNSGRPLPGYNHYTGLMVYGVAPVVAGKWAEVPGPPIIKRERFFSIKDAENAGIVPFTDNTAPTGTYLITTQGATGDKIQIQIEVPKAYGLTEIVDFGIYTKLITDNSIAALGASITAMINAGTVNHGYSATFNTATITITAPKSVGKSLNGITSIIVTITGTIAGTIGQFTNGTASPYSIWHYHIDRFFKNFASAGQGVFDFGIIAATSSFTELNVLQAGAGSKLRQIGLYDNHATRGLGANIAATVLGIQSAASLSENKAPYLAVYSPNMYGVTDLGTYTDQNLNTSKLVEIVISQDGAGEGDLLFVVNQQSIGNIGEKLATIAKSRVSASDAQPIPKFNLAFDGSENNIPAFANGQLSSAVAIGLQEQLHNFRYTFFVSYSDDVIGTYWSDNKTAIVSTSSYCFVNDVRVSHMVSRICRATLIPELSSELIFNKDNTLKTYTISYFRKQVINAVTAGMITGFGALPMISDVDCTIDATQKVKSLNKLVIVVAIVENGIAREIEVQIGLN